MKQKYRYRPSTNSVSPPLIPQQIANNKYSLLIQEYFLSIYASTKQVLM